MENSDLGASAEEADRAAGLRPEPATPSQRSSIPCAARVVHIPTQADRVAAQECATEMGLGFTAEEIAAGEADNCSLVQSFARHRDSSVGRALADRAVVPREEYDELYKIYLEDCDDTVSRDSALRLAIWTCESRADDLAHSHPPEFEDHRAFENGRHAEACYLASKLKALLG